MDKINENEIQHVAINGISEKSFDKLNDEQKKIVLAGNNETQGKSKDAGRLGEFLGANTQNASVHIALIICGVLLLFCGIDLIHSFFPEQALNFEMWKLIFPVITLALGYVFGKGGSD